MALSDTACRILAEAAQHLLRLAVPPDKLPTAAARAVLMSLLEHGYVDACETPGEFADLCWHQRDGSWPTVRISEGGIAAFGGPPVVTATPTDTEAASADTDLAETVHEPDSAPLAAPAVAEPHQGPTGADPALTPCMVFLARPSLRDAAHRILAAWDDTTGERKDLPHAITALRAILVKAAPAARTGGVRKPREGTKQQQVLALLRRPEGATVARIAEANGWQAHTVRGFFAGSSGAKGSYTVYRIAEEG